MSDTPKTDAMYQANADYIAGLQRDKARLDWLEAQYGVAIWRGVMTDTNTPVYDIHEPREEGWDDACGEELGSGPSLRAAIDEALRSRPTPAPPETTERR
jgi:hypothetical protein